MGKGARCGRRPSSSILSGRGGNKVASKSSVSSRLVLVQVTSAYLSCGTLPNVELDPVCKCFVAFQILSLSTKNSSSMRSFPLADGRVILPCRCLSSFLQLVIRAPSTPCGPRAVTPVCIDLPQLREVGCPPSFCIRRWSSLGMWV